MTWLLGVRIVILLLALRRLSGDVLGVWRGRLPATRLVLPLLLLTAALLIANHLIPRSLVMAALAVIDLVFLAVCFMLVASLRAGAPHLSYREERLQQVFERFFPSAVARVAGLEIVVYAHILAGLKGFINPPAPSPSSYVNGSKIAMVAIILTLSVVPDAFLLWLLLPHHLWWLAIVLDVLEVWSCAWLFGLYGTMIARPHEIHEKHVVFHNGIVKRIRIERGEVVAARALGVVKRRALPRVRGDAVLLLGGVPVVEVELRTGKKVFVASDAPQALCTLLQA